MFPRNLLSAGCHAERVAYPLEHGLDGAVWRANVLEESAGVLPVSFALSVSGNLTGRGSNDAGDVSYVVRQRLFGRLTSLLRARPGSKNQPSISLMMDATFLASTIPR